MSRLTWAYAALGSLAASGCVSMDAYTWEQAGKVDEVVIRMTEVADPTSVCAQYLPGQKVLACAVQHAEYCEIIVPPNSPSLVAHEAAHCLGYMHKGESNILTASRRWREKQALQQSASAVESTAAGSGISVSREP